VTVDQIVDFLNESLELDREAVQTLFATYCHCNQAMADHPTIVVDVDRSCLGAEEATTVGLLGFFQGIAAIDGMRLEGVFNISGTSGDDPDFELIAFHSRPIQR
jgi:hypothetical protein